MRKLEKFLKRLSSKERETAELLIMRILERDFKDLDIKKLKGHRDIYRVRKGGLRIIFLDDSLETKLLAIERRNEGTYRDY